MCSVIGNQLSSFNGEHIDLASITSINSSCPVLMLAECSPQSNFAVFVSKLDSKRYVFKVLSRNNFVEYSPIDDHSSSLITINGHETASVAHSAVDVGDIK